MTDLDFDALTTPARDGAGFTIEVPDGWQQGRGCFGGLVMAALVRAAEATIGDPARTVRALAGEILGPVQPGRAAIAVETLRAGNNVTSVAARLVQEGEVQAHAVCVGGGDRGTYAIAPTLAPPAMPPWRDLAPAPIGPPHAPVFTQHVEFRLVGPPPFGGSGDGVESAGWVRLKRPGRARDAAWLVAMVDTWWPALLTALRTPRPIATLTFAFERCGDPASVDPDAPLFYRARMLAGEGGYGVEARELWSEDGRLLALNQQTIVVIK